MAEHCCSWITRPEISDKVVHRYHLFQGAGIGRLAVLVQSALITYCYRLSVVAFAMCSLHHFRTHLLYRSVLTDIIMIPPTGITHIPMGSIYVFSGEVPVDTRRRTMHDNQRDFTLRTRIWCC